MNSKPYNYILRVLSLAILFFTVLALLAEMLARLPAIEKAIPYRSLGNYDYQFEIKWFRLQEFVDQNGGVDVIFLGNSLVNTGIVPEIVAQTYYEQTGIKLRIFNFGVEGLTIAPISHLARILVEQYHPALLVYVTDMRDYVAGNGLETEARFLADPWIRYRSGTFTFFGWLADHSKALQVYLPYRNWTNAGFFEMMSFYTTRLKKTSVDGYEPDLGVGTGIDVPPDPNDPQDVIYFDILKDYRIAPSRLGDLKDILDRKADAGTAVLVVEMPVHPTFYIYAGGDAVHRQFQSTLRAFVAMHAGEFIPAESCNRIPLEGRSNRWHLNYLGAPAFSLCLGKQLAVLARQSGSYFIKADPSEK
jgi:hypothetical protein